jgi:hypothetical protein
MRKTRQRDPKTKQRGSAKRQNRSRTRHMCRHRSYRDTRTRIQWASWSTSLDSHKDWRHTSRRASRTGCHRHRQGRYKYSYRDCSMHRHLGSGRHQISEYNKKGRMSERWTGTSRMEGGTDPARKRQTCRSSVHVIGVRELLIGRRTNRPSVHNKLKTRKHESSQTAR